MTLLVPLGLLGLLGVVALIIIYIIKPNFQQKFVSSTYVWKLSLKYKRRRFTTNNLRNILIIICQILALTALAVILSKPAVILKTRQDKREVIAVIDASASMRTETDGVSRFERAVNSVVSLAESTFDSDGTVSVILAGHNSSFVVQRVSKENKQTALDGINALLDAELTCCSYASADMNEAMLACEQVTDVNPDAEVYVFTDTEFTNKPKGVNVNLIRNDAEWNFAILGANAELVDGIYVISVDMACYGRNELIDLELAVHGANEEAVAGGAGVEKIFKAERISLDGDRVKRVVFKYNLGNDDINTDDVEYVPVSVEDRIFSFSDMVFSVEADDNFVYDNNFYVYGGKKEVLKVQYASSEPNKFFPNTINRLADIYKSKYEIVPTYVKEGEEPKLEGFDFYVFEHKMPEVLPSDGIVYLVDPDKSPNGAGFTVKQTVPSGKINLPLSDNLADGTDPLMNYLTATDIWVNLYRKLVVTDGAYKILMSANGDPMYMYKETDDGVNKQKIIVCSFSVHYSNITILPEFSLMMYDMFEYFFPVTVEKNYFEVFEELKLNARGESLTVTVPGGEEPRIIESFPASITVSIPGVYTLTQKTFANKEIVERVYVKIPAKESDIAPVEDVLPDPYVKKSTSDYFGDVLFYVACALVALILAEWFLHSREEM